MRRSENIPFSGNFSCFRAQGLPGEWVEWLGGLQQDLRDRRDGERLYFTNINNNVLLWQQVRTRTVIQQPVHGGRHCPSLRDYKWCGSARNCKQGEWDIIIIMQIQTNSYWSVFLFITFQDTSAGNGRHEGLRSEDNHICRVSIFFVKMGSLKLNTTFNACHVWKGKHLTLFVVKII